MIAIWRNVVLSFCITRNWLGDLLITQTELSSGCWQRIIMQIWLFLPLCLFCLTLVLLRGWTARQGSAFMHIHWTHCWILTAAYLISTWMHYWQPKATYHEHNVAVFKRIWINSNFLVGLISLFTMVWVLLCFRQARMSEASVICTDNGLNVWTTVCQICAITAMYLPDASVG